MLRNNFSIACQKPPRFKSVYSKTPPAKNSTVCEQKKKYVKQSINSFLHRNCLWINYPNCWNKGDTWYSYLSAFGNYWRITFAQFLEIFLWLCIVLHKPSILETSVLENKIALRNGVGWDFKKHCAREKISWGVKYERDWQFGDFFSQRNFSFNGFLVLFLGECH